MRIAIFSDVHGNLTALDAVLADIARQAPDWTVFAGDLCVLGGRPAACLDRVRETADFCVYGNTDEWLHTPPPIPDGISDEVRQSYLTFHELLQWTRDQLGDVALGWLSRLPFSGRISPMAVSTQDIVIAHANPIDVLQPIFPSAADQKAMIGMVKKEQPDAEIEVLFAGFKAAVFAFGHVHMPNTRHLGRLLLANISSVSLPQDGDRRAKYGLLTWENGSGWTVEQRRVEYNLQQEGDVLTQKQPPDWENLRRRLQA